MNSASKRPNSSHEDRQRLGAQLDMYLGECYDASVPANVDEFSQRVGLSRPYVSSEFIRVFGKSARSLLWERRVEYAAKLLETTTLTTAEIAKAAAFGTEPTFFKVFRRLLGMTPGEYRAHLTNI